MKQISKIVVVCVAAAAMVLSCKQDNNSRPGGEEETPTSGSASILVDNTIQPIVEDVLAVFHSVYDRAHITQVNMTESEIVNALIRDSARVAVLPRLLTKEEESRFRAKGISPKVTFFGTDAVALIANEAATDTIIELEEVLKVLRGQPSKAGKLVFDNANSSTIQMLLKQAGVSKIPTENIFALKTNEEVIKFVRNNPGCIGVIGANWLFQPPPSLIGDVENLTVLAVDNVKIDKGVKKYYKPTQSTIGAGSYPLTRKLYVLNYLGKYGLGTGFANYLGAHEGQRIVLKSGLLPAEIPAREIEVRKKL